MPQLVLIRHGQSEWNLQNRFTGWVDVDLTPEGESQALRAGELLAEAGIKPDFAYVSLLKRAIKTLNLTLETLDLLWLPVEKHWRLNERHYGDLAGRNKQETIEAHGADQVLIWRRSFDIPPPPVPNDHEYHPRNDARYKDIPVELLPASESLKTTLERVMPYWTETIAPRMASGETVIVAAHGNSLRAIIKMMFDVDDLGIIDYEVPTGNPLLIDLDPSGTKPVSARYLDESRAKSIPPIPGQ